MLDSTAVAIAAGDPQQQELKERSMYELYHWSRATTVGATQPGEKELFYWELA